MTNYFALFANKKILFSCGFILHKYSHGYLMNVKLTVRWNVNFKRIKLREIFVRGASIWRRRRRRRHRTLHAISATPVRRKAKINTDWYVDGLSAEFYPTGNYPRFVAKSFSRVVKRHFARCKIRIKHYSKSYFFVRIVLKRK